jgi:hypothetical protein
MSFEASASNRWSPGSEGKQFQCATSGQMHPLWAVLIGVAIACFCFAIVHAVKQHL